MTCRHSGWVVGSLLAVQGCGVVLAQQDAGAPASRVPAARPEDVERAEVWCDPGSWQALVGRRELYGVELQSAAWTPGRHEQNPASVLTAAEAEVLKRIPPASTVSLVRLGDARAGRQAEGLSKTFLVTEESADFRFWYAAILEDPHHFGFPEFRFRIRDKGRFGDRILETLRVRACRRSRFAGKIDGVFYQDWTEHRVDLRRYLDRRVTVELITADCPYGEHFGYALVGFACPPAARPVAVDLDVDSGRDGSIEDLEDEPFELSFDHAAGAVLLANLDDDDRDGQRDADNAVIDGEHDLADLEPLELRVSGWPAGSALELVLRVPGEMAGRLRIFPVLQPGARSVLGPDAGVDRDGFKEHVLTVDREDRTWHFAVEGLGPPRAGSGDVEIELVARHARAGTTVAADRVRLRISPWLMSSSLQPAEVVYQQAGLGCEAFYGESEVVQVEFDWVQDRMEIGYSSSPRASMHVIVPFDLESHPFDVGALSGPGVAVLEPFARPWKGAFGDSLDKFGNLEVTPALVAEGREWPLGRIYYGGGGAGRMSSEFRDFLAAQGIQGPVELDTTWLRVGHVDEMLAFIPNPGVGKDGEKPFKVLLASPWLARQLAHVQQPEEEQLPCSGAFEPFVRAERELIKTTFGLTEHDLIDIPVCFIQEDQRARAVGVNMVNVLVVGQRLFMPVPGDVDRSKPAFEALEQDVRQKLEAIGYRVAAECGQGAGPPDTEGATVHFVDTSSYDSGEAHCVTNVRRTPAGVPWWTLR